MKHHEIRREDGRVTFGATDRTVGYAILGLLLVFVGGSLFLWWPGDYGELWRPWTELPRGELDALIWAVLVASVGGLFVVAGGYLSDRGRCHELEFDGDRQIVSIREWWRRVEVRLELVFERFAEFVVHRPVGGRDCWQLGVVLENGSYWRLDRDADRERLDDIAGRLDEEMEFESGKAVPGIEPPGRIDLEVGKKRFTARWNNRERPMTRGLTAVATLLFSIAVVAPALLVFDGVYGPLVAALVVGAVLFGAPLFGAWSSKVKWPFVAGWFVVVIAAVVGLQAHWAYFAIATAGGAIFARSGVQIVKGFWSPEVHSLAIDDEGRIYEDDQLVEMEGEMIRIDDLEGALINVTEVRPPILELVLPGGGEENRDRYLGRLDSEDVDHAEPVELETPGLSLFEHVGLALLVDDVIRGRIEVTEVAEVAGEKK